MGNSGRLLYGVSSQHDLYHKDFFWCWFIIRDNYILDFSSPSWFDTHSMIPNDTAVTSKCFNNDHNYQDYYQYSDYDHSPSLLIWHTQDDSKWYLSHRSAIIMIIIITIITNILILIILPRCGNKKLFRWLPQWR